MRADSRFVKQEKPFWANVRTMSQALGYTDKKTRQIRVYTLREMLSAMDMVELGKSHLVDEHGIPTPLARLLEDYFAYRADVLNHYVQPRLMNVKDAAQTFEALKASFPSIVLTVPMNKQKGDKKAPAYLTGMVNLLIEAYSGGLPCDTDPRKLTSVTKDGAPLRTFARRVDGCFPSCINPVAVWEIKEYYYTTTFGSRVADGVYETLLDGLEIEELREHEGIDIQHLLIVDAYKTWWEDGRSYLCRIVDMLNMGYVDEVLFGREVLERMPAIVQEWVAIARNRL